MRVQLEVHIDLARKVLLAILSERHILYLLQLQPLGLHVTDPAIGVHRGSCCLALRTPFQRWKRDSIVLLDGGLNVHVNVLWLLLDACLMVFLYQN